MNHKSFLSVIRGKYKNKKIAVPEKIHGHNNVTPQKIKESVFQIIENHFHTANPEENKAVFVDLFSGSGQMGIEAVSRGFNHVFFFDISKERIRKTSQWIRQNAVSETQKCTCEVKDGVREFYKILTDTSCVSDYLRQNPEAKELVIFSDPPYGLNSKKKYLLDFLIENKTTIPGLEKDWSLLLIIQTCDNDLYRSEHSEIQKFPETGKPEYVRGYYKYGRHLLIVM